MVYSYKYTLARRAIVATFDLSAENLDLFESDLLLFEKKEVCSYQDRTCLFGETRKRFSWQEKKGLVCGKRRRCSPLDLELESRLGPTGFGAGLGIQPERIQERIQERTQRPDPPPGSTQITHLYLDPEGSFPDSYI